MVNVNPLLEGVESGMFGHPARNPFASVSPICWLLIDKMHCLIPQVLKNMGVPVKIKRLSHRYVDKERSTLERVRMTPRAVESLLLQSGWAT